MDLGHHAGENAWAASQGFAPRAFAFKQRLVMAFNMGRHSLARLFGVMASGLPAWFFSRMSNLATMPGLERNLRILIDWTLDVPFRADIAVLAPEISSRLQTLHFEAGDEVIRQGDLADTAYVVRSGTLEVLRSGKPVGTLSPGDFFGEMALMKGTRRTATVRCLTTCELTVFAKEDFDALSMGSSSLAKAIRAQASERSASKGRSIRTEKTDPAKEA
jgi:CRP-like cAMP-binding protein